MDGLLLIDKPKGWTSFDVVAKVRSILRTEIRNGKLENSKKIKVGHTGTLDPLATGLLVLTIGSYCKRAQEFSKLDKVYEVELKLGETSTTDDGEGEKTSINQPIPAENSIKQVILSFVGEIEQVPPQFSAIKIDGQRAYKMAREGKEVVIEPRKVKIYDITEVTYNYPKVTFTAKVSSGTYIRSLVRDIGQKLGCGAYMTNLRRTSVGKFSINKATTVEDVDNISLKVI